MTKEILCLNTNTLQAPAYLCYLQLTKPKLMLMALVTTWTGFYMATAGHSLNVSVLIHALIGAGLVGGGANALNQYFERDYDRNMQRTQNRPICSGQIEEKKALYFGAALTLAGLAHLIIFTNYLTAFFGFLTAFVYLYLYTPLKRTTVLNTFVGAIAGALPTLIGWSAATNELSAKAWPFFWVLFFWQLPHFFAIAWVYKTDYENGGFEMMSRGEDGEKRSAWAIAISALALFFVSFSPVFYGMAGLLYLSGAFFAGLFFTTFSIYVATHRLIFSKALVSASIFYLMAINFFILIDKV